MPYQNELQRITAVLLRTDDNYQELTRAVEDLFLLFLKTTGLNPEDEKNREDIHLEGGKAIGPIWAALCIKEMLRTKRFIRGLYLGIQAALNKFAIRPIHVVYAGTGPFAALAVPLTTVFSSEDVKFTFLEINPASVEYLKRLVDAVQAAPFVREILLCDAATYQADPSAPIHVVVSETMQAALKKEPQVAITLNLAPQLVPGGILIPETITVEAVLIDPKKDMERLTSIEGIQTEYYRSLGNIFELDKNTAAKYSSLPADPPHAFPETKLQIPQDIPLEYRQLSLLTHIRVFAGEHLGPGDCSLTTPQNIRTENRTGKQVRHAGFRYRMGPSPEFVVETSH